MALDRKLGSLSARGRESLRYEATTATGWKGPG